MTDFDIMEEKEGDMKGYGYVRRSTDDGKSTTQDYIDALNLWAEEKGITDFLIFVDDGIEGGGIDNRPGFCDLLEAMKAELRDFLATNDETRIGRIKDIVERAKVVKIFMETVKRIIIVDEDDETIYDMAKEESANDFFDQLSEARKENLRRGRFIRKGHKAKMRKGNYSAGRQPVGAIWDKETEKWFPHATEVAGIHKALEMIKDGCGFDLICRELNERPEFALRTFKNGRPRKWKPTTLYRTICTYDFLHTGKIVSKAHGFEIDTGLLLIDKDRILEARNLVTHKNKRGGTKRTWDFLLKGLVTCDDPECDDHWMMSSVGFKRGEKEWKYYRAKCCGLNKKAETLEAKLRREFARVFGDDERLLWLIQKEAFIPKSKRRNLEAKLAHISEKLMSLEAKLKIAKELRLDGDLTKAEYETRKGDLITARNPLEAEKNRIENSLAKPDLMMKWAAKVSKEVDKRFSRLNLLIRFKDETDEEAKIELANKIKTEVAGATKVFDPTKPMPVEGGKLDELIFGVEREIYSRVKATGGEILVGKDTIEIVIPDVAALVGDSLKNTLALPRSGAKGYLVLCQALSQPPLATYAR